MHLLRILFVVFLCTGTCMQVDAQLVKKHGPETYIVQHFNDDALLFKEHILYYMKFPKEIAGQAIRGILKANIYFDAQGRITEAKPISNFGFGLEESLVKAVDKYKKNRQAITRSRLTGTDTASYYLFQLPIGMYTDKFINRIHNNAAMIASQSPVSISLTTASKVDFALVADMVHLSAGYDNFNVSAVLPRDYTNFLDGFTIYFYEYMHINRRKKIFEDLPIGGAAMIKFRIDKDGRIIDISHHGNKNDMSKVLIEVFKGYTSNFKWKNYEQAGKMSPLELGLYIDLRAKRERISLFKDGVVSDIFSLPE